MLGIKLLIVIGITGLTFLALRPIRIDREAKRTTVKGIPLVLNLLVLLIAFVIVQGFGTVPTGHQGIVLRWSAATGAMKHQDSTGLSLSAIVLIQLAFRSKSVPRP